MKWFIRRGLFFVPSSLIGWMLLSISFIYGIYAFFDIDKHSHSASDTLMNWFFRLLLIAVAYSIIGSLTSKEHN
jgi:hypothetical protein